MLRRTPLRKKSRKRAREDCRDRAGVEAFALQFAYCWICGDGERIHDPLEVHHIAGRKHPKRNARANLFRVHSSCHDREFTSRTKEVATVDEEHSRHINLLIQTLAYKRAHDPEGFCMETVLQIKGLEKCDIDPTTIELLAGHERMKGRPWRV